MELSYQGNTHLGEPIYVYHPSQGFAIEVLFGGFLGNPAVEFNSGATPNILVSLSNADASPADTTYFQYESVQVQELILTSDLSDAACSSIGEPGNPVNPVFATFGGNYFMHDPRFVSKVFLIIVLHVDMRCSPF